MDMDADAVIVGAGVVGLACAYALSRRGRNVIVLEKETRIGAGVSARNSEVIHAGIHYPPGSLKARLCVEGRRMLYDFLPAHGVAFEKSEKLIVATSESELDSIRALHVRGVANGVEGLRLLPAAEARAMEPALACAGALYSPESGQLDAHGLMLALQGELESAGGAIALNTPFTHAAPITNGWRVAAAGASLDARTLILAAGLGAQECARAVEGFPSARIPPRYLGKGVYFALTGKAPFQRLIYPPPIPGALGIHYKRDMGGRAHFGPDLEFVASETYDIDERRVDSFYAYIRRFWPDLPDGALTPDYAGIRPKIHGPDEPQPDFMIDDATLPNLVALFGIESPGLTCSLALGEEVARRLEQAA